MFQFTTKSIIPIHKPELTQQSKSLNYNWKTLTKAGLVFVTTTGVFLTLKTTGSFNLISSWLKNSPPETDLDESSALANFNNPSTQTYITPASEKQPFIAHHYAKRESSAVIKLGPEFQVNTYTTSDQEYPSVTGLSDGKFVVTWQSDGQDGSPPSIYAQIYNADGSKYSSEFQAHMSTTKLSESNPSVAGLSDGKFVVTWETGLGFNVCGQIFNANGTKFLSEFQVNTYMASSQNYPSAAGLSNGKFVVTWESFGQDGSYGGVYGQMFFANGTKYLSEFQVNTYTTNWQESPSVAGLSDGKFVVTWQSYGQDGSGEGIYGQLYNADGSKYSSEFQVSTYTINDQQYPSVAGLSDGKFVVTWESDDQYPINLIYGQIFNANGTKFSSEFTIIAPFFEPPHPVAGLSDGKFVVTYTFTILPPRIYGQMFNANGTKFFLASQVSTDTINWKSESSVTGLSDGKFVVTWQSDGQDGDGSGIYGQLFMVNETLASSYLSSSSQQIPESSSTVSNNSTAPSIESSSTTVPSSSIESSVSSLNQSASSVEKSSSPTQSTISSVISGQSSTSSNATTQSSFSSSGATEISSYSSSISTSPSTESSSTAMPSSSIESSSGLSDQSASSEGNSTSSSNTKSSSESKLSSSSSNIVSQTNSSKDRSSSSISRIKSQSLSRQSSSLQSSVSTSNFFSSQKSSSPISSTESQSSPKQSESTSIQETPLSTSITEEESSNSALITSAQSQRLSSSETGGTNSMVIMLAAIIGGVCVVLCIAGSGVGYWLYRRKRDNETDEESCQLSELEVLKSPKSKGVKPVGIDPQKLKKFEKIGRGAMGIVYKAKYHGGDKPRDVAIKQMPIDLDDYDAVRQLANEATLMEELKHSNIVQLLGYYQELMNFNIVMEYVSGGELTKVLYDTDQAFPWPTRWDIAHDIASAVHYLHTNDVIQIIHRDLKSPNVLIYYQGARMRAKVADVGIAKVISEKETATMTKGMGTPLWMAPEVVKAQGEGKKITYDEKVDVYSYGIILSELINREEPFSEIENRFEVVPFVLRGGQPEIKEKAPASFIALMKQCWAHRPADRPEMENVVDTLNQIEQEVKSFECE